MIQDKHVPFVKYLLLTIVVVLNFVVVHVTTAQEVYVQTGFEEFAVGNTPDDWEITAGDIEVTKNTVKTEMIYSSMKAQTHSTLPLILPTSSPHSGDKLNADCKKSLLVLEVKNEK